jgi:hypothetical protein
MDALIAKLSERALIELAQGAIWMAGLTLIAVAWAIRSAVVGHAFYKYRAKKRRGWEIEFNHEPKAKPADEVAADMRQRVEAQQALGVSA